MRLIKLLLIFLLIGNCCYTAKSQITANVAVTVNQDTCIASGIKENNELTHFSIVPNPSQGFFQINTQFAFETPSYSLIISDVMGRIIYQSNENAIANKLINLSDVDKGVYYITITSKKAVYFNRILIF